MPDTGDIGLKYSGARGGRRGPEGACLGSLVDSPLCSLASIKSQQDRLRFQSKGKTGTSPRSGAVWSPAEDCFHFLSSVHSHRLGVTRWDFFFFFSLPGNLERCSTSCSTSLKRLEEHVMFSLHLSLNSANWNVLANLVCRYNTDTLPHTHPQKQNVFCPCYLTCDIVS